VITQAKKMKGDLKMKDIHIIALTPNEFRYYESIENALKNSISIEDDEETGKAIIKISKAQIEKLFKDEEFFAEIILDDMIKEIIWE